MLHEEIFTMPPVSLESIVLEKPDTISPQTTGINRANWQNAYSHLENYSQNAGVYTFWWKINTEFSLPVSVPHWVKGKRKGTSDPDPLPPGCGYFQHGETEFIHYNGSWHFPNQDFHGERYVALYVGKSTNIRNRIENHLKFSQPHVAEYSNKLADNLYDDLYVIPKYTSSSQLNDYYYFMFRNLAGMGHEAKLKYVHLSVSFTPFVDYADRFYKEDLLIGELRPPFNLDSER